MRLRLRHPPCPTVAAVFAGPPIAQRIFISTTRGICTGQRGVFDRPERRIEGQRSQGIWGTHDGRIYQKSRGILSTHGGRIHPPESQRIHEIQSRRICGYASRHTPWNRERGATSFTPSRLVQTTAEATPTTAEASTTSADLPHRQRQARRRSESSEASSTLTLPTNASSTLTDVSASHSSPIARHLSSFLSLSKPRLSALVVLSAMAPYALYPVPALLSADVTATPSLSPQTLLFLTLGTALCSASANALNMLYEPKTDALMSRTRNRPLVRALISTRAALGFATAAAIVGTGALYFGVNPTVAFLGAANIALYAGVYTPLKRVTAFNTWVGAVVGGIPPLMGWAAAAGESATDGSFRELLFSTASNIDNGDVSSIGGWLLAGLLFAWQFPHFMALSWPVREEYRTAGLRMLAWTNPARNARVALRYSLAFIPLCAGLCAAGVTEWSFAATSLPVNAWLAYRAVAFYRTTGAAGSARGLFWASVWHLPVVMVLALLQKKGMWGRVLTAVLGDDDEWEDVE